MSGLETIQGQTAFVSARVDAYHHLGTTLSDSFTADDAMKHGLLGGWNLRKQPMQVDLGGGLLIPAQGRYGVVRDNPVIEGQVDFIGDVGEAYTIIQNEELAGLLDALVDESGAHFETAGALDGGKRVFITMKLPQHIKIGGVDPIDQYLAITTSHDGSSSTMLATTPVRIACKNLLNMAFRDASNVYRVRHTVGASRILMQQAREALEISFSYLDGFQQQAEELINTTMTQSTFEQMIEREFGAPEGAPVGTVTRAQNKLDQMADLFSDADTHKGMRNTAWAGLNALTEWYDHFSPVRGVAASDEATVRSRKAMLDPAFKNRALELVLATV